MTTQESATIESAETIELKNLIVEQTQTWYLIACDKFKLTPRELKINFNLRGTTAGTANTSAHIIEYNLTLAIENKSDFINRTVPHEVAHIIANRYFNKNCGHKSEWKYIMIQFGLKPDRCHSYDVSNVSRKKIKYFCTCGNVFQVGLNLHKKIQNGSTHYCNAKGCKKTPLKLMRFEA